MGLEETGQSQGTLAVGLHAQAQGLQALEKHPGIERAHAGPGGTQKAEHALTHRHGIADHRPADTAALAVDVLGGRMDDDVGAEIQRPLQGRGAEGIVHHQLAAVGVGQFGQGTDVGDLGQGIGRRLQEQQLRFRPDGRLPGGKIGQRHEAHVHPEGLDVLVEQHHGAAEDGSRGDDVIPGLQQPHDRSQDGRHARGRGHATLAPFQRRQPFLEGAHRGIGEA